MKLPSFLHRLTPYTKTFADRPDAPGDLPALYEIRVRGAFDQKWRGLAEGMTLEVVHEKAQPVTVIRVVVQDQARWPVCLMRCSA
jgi:hypothetical protein